MEMAKEASSESSLQISNLSISGGNGNGFLSHRPMSAGIDSILQGFKFAATSRKPPGTAVVETDNQVNGNGKTRERIGNNDALQSRVGCAVGRQDKDGMEAMKIQVPLFSAATIVPSLLHNPLNPQVVLPPEASAPRDQMLPPFKSIRPIERGQKTMPLQGSVKEKRKRTQSSSSFRSDSEHDQFDQGRLLPREDGQRGYMAVSGEKDPGTRGKPVRTNEKKVTEGRSSDDKRPRKRHERSAVISRPQNEPPANPSSNGNKSTEVIILDDDIKPEPTEVEVSIPDPRGGDSNNSHNPGLPGSVYENGKHRRDKNTLGHMDQPLKQHMPLQKDINRYHGTIRDLPDGKISTSETHASARLGRTSNGYSSTNSRLSVGSNGAPKNRRMPIESSCIPGGSSSQQLNYKTHLPSHVPVSCGDPSQSSSGEHKLLVALTALTTEKQSLEHRLRETMSSLSTQVLCTEAAEKKNAELEIHVATYKDTVSGLKNRILGAQKFVDGLGNDYNMLNEKKTQLSKSINQLSWDRDELRRDLKEVSDLTEKAGVKMQEWGDSSAVLKGSQKEIRRLQETLKFLHNQLSENAGLLAAERDRTQSLECQIQEDRERNRVILESIQDVKAEVIEQLAGLKGTLEGKDGSELMERLIKAQTIMEMRIGEDGGATRNLIHSYSKSIEKLGDRDVDATELLLGVEKRVSNASVSMVDLFYETHKMNAEALSYSDGYISHLNSRIANLEAELKEIYEKYEVSLVESAEKRHVTNEYELRLKDALKKCDDMSAQVQRGNAVEKTLNEVVSTLKKNIGILEARTAEDPSMVATINMLKQKNFNLEREFNITKDTLQNTILASQTKDGEIETLRCELETLKLRYKEAEKKIEGFVEEKAGFMALAEEQKTKERIEVETNANMFRKRETSRLHNQIKSLEAQKMKLEADNKEFKTMLAEGANAEIELRTEIQELNKQNADIEASHTGLLQENIRLENAVSHLTQLRETSNTSHRALERIIGITADELSKALEKINILQSDKELATEEITLKELELKRAKSDRSEILTTTRDIIALRIIETNLRAALEESEKENQVSRVEKESAINTLEARTKALDKALKELRESRGKSKPVFSQHEQDNSPNEQIRKLGGYSRGAVNEHTGVFKKVSPTTGISLHTPDFNAKRQNPYARVASEIMGSPLANSLSISPLTSPEPIPETQIDHRTWSDSPRANLPKGSEILDIWDSQATNLDLQHRPSNKTDESNDFIMSEGSPGDRVKTVDTPPLRSTCPEKRTLTPFTPRPQMLDILDNEAEKHTPATPNRPKTPLRYRNTRGTTNDTKKHQNRPRKDRRKKTKDDQEWSEDETESSRNIKGKEEPPNTKKNLRSFKDKKKGGKKNL